MERFKDQVVLITGAASGIGRAAAEAFLNEGASVMLADIDAEMIARVAKELGQGGHRVAAVDVDVRNRQSCQRMVDRAVETFGGLHIAFNNAGVPSALYSEFEDLEGSDWDRVIGVNLSGMFNAMSAETPALRASRGTAIVNTVSMMSTKSAPGMAAYVASKHGAAGLTRSAALDLIRHGIRVNAICPGFVDTPMLAPMLSTEEGRTSIEGMIPIGRVASSDEIARAALFLASKDASYLVGALVTVDGGVTVQ